MGQGTSSRGTKLTLEADVIPLLKRWTAARCWGQITIHFVEGVPTQMIPAPSVTSSEQAIVHFPRLAGPDPEDNLKS